VVVWGTGKPKREFLYSEDMADACVTLMSTNDESFNAQATQYPPLINIGCGVDLTIRELAELVAKTIGFKGALKFDTSKPDGTPRKLLDVGRLFSLGWRPTVPLDAGIKAAYLDFLQRQPVVACSQFFA
jgi:GDP-L-fucose synthase